MNPMLPSLLLNAFVVGTVVTVLWVTKNPLAILGLFFLQQMPVIVQQGGDGQDEEEEPESAGIGFIR